jgi:transcription-repair coupling factor (superfamily II helicase)
MSNIALASIAALPEYEQILADLRSGEHLPGQGLPRAARLPLLAQLYADLNCPILYLTGRFDRALTYLDELGFWAPEAPRRGFPEPNPLFYERAAWGAGVRRDRIQALTSLAVYHIHGAARPDKPPVIVAPVRSVMARTLPRRDFIKQSKLLKTGLEISPEGLQRQWVEIGYQAAEIVLEPGQFSRRGGLLDIWPPAENHPVRLDFFGDEIDSMRRFDPATQRTIQRIDALLVTPAREVLKSKLEAEVLPLDEEEFYLPVAHPMPASILDYLPQHSLVLVDDLDYLQSTAADIEEQAVKLRLDSIREGTLPEDFPVPYISWSEIQDMLGAHTWFELGHTTALDDSPLAARFTPGPRFAGRMKHVMDYMVELCEKRDTVVAVSRQANRLKELWSQTQGIDELTCTPQCIDGTLSDGWVLDLVDGRRLSLLTDSEIFGWERPRPRQRRSPAAEAPEASYNDFKPGDWVVHVDYGIGRYIGLVQRTLEGAEREFLAVEYEDGDQLFVPVHQADRLGRYIGSSSEDPTPTRLGTAEWANTKQRVREAVEEVARELLELYARRQLARGVAFQPDTAWQKELEASFPYIETEDQIRAIREVKEDMESVRPMDRLLCGDVGYGKTEVALRAAFKAVMDGKQVAVLVPTTVLAQQHFETFCQRLAAYPVTVEMLSRFRSQREQDTILKNLVNGSIDIVIGTHRLVQPDVQFKDLGLVIIDEEQRFGVTHKEYLKRLRTEVDVLTLTATPIPRTLYMALTGVRDISTINTPPEERLPIVTQAVLRELERGGQAFFVHNRVQTIRSMEKHLSSLVPEARVGVAHGQMHESELARVMHLFTHGEIDVLLCTSIIESGLDIPNANTLIVDRADTFGLAQLYQLRGRVGRSAQRAYAYFFRHRRKPPTPEGQERLEIITENKQLGAGYSIAMRDLEMRGAGELLGTRQHGYIASVGFHLYTRLLGQAVRELKFFQGQTDVSGYKLDLQAPHLQVSVDFPFPVGIPANYVPDQLQRLRLYRRLADLNSEEQIVQMVDEFRDRFGPLPEQVRNLIYQIRVRLLAEAAGLASVNLEADQVVLRYPPLPEGVNSRNLPPVGFRARTGKNAYWMAGGEDIDEWKERLLQLLSAIIET